MATSPRVSFKIDRIAENSWEIVASYPGLEDRYIKGLRSKSDVDDWMSGSRKLDWLRSHGYAK